MKQSKLLQEALKSQRAEILREFNWRWNAYLKNEYTQQQFSTGFRKQLK